MDPSLQFGFCSSFPWETVRTILFFCPRSPEIPLFVRFSSTTTSQGPTLFFPPSWMFPLVSLTQVLFSVYPFFSPITVCPPLPLDSEFLPPVCSSTREFPPPVFFRFLSALTPPGHSPPPTRSVLLDFLNDNECTPRARS